MRRSKRRRVLKEQDPQQQQQQRDESEEESPACFAGSASSDATVDAGGAKPVGTITEAEVAALKAFVDAKYAAELRAIDEACDRVLKEINARAAVFSAQAADDGAQSEADSAQSAESRVQTTKREAHAAKLEAQATEGRAQSAKLDAQAAEDRAQAAGDEVRVAKLEAQAAEDRAQAAEGGAQAEGDRAFLEAQAAKERARVAEFRARIAKLDAQAAEERALTAKLLAQSAENRAYIAQCRAETEAKYAFAAEIEAQCAALREKMAELERDIARSKESAARTRRESEERERAGASLMSRNSVGEIFAAKHALPILGAEYGTTASAGGSVASRGPPTWAPRDADDAVVEWTLEDFTNFLTETSAQPVFPSESGSSLSEKRVIDVVLDHRPTLAAERSLMGIHPPAGPVVSEADVKSAVLRHFLEPLSAVFGQEPDRVDTLKDHDAGWEILAALKANLALAPRHGDARPALARLPTDLAADLRVGALVAAVPIEVHTDATCPVKMSSTVFENPSLKSAYETSLVEYTRRGGADAASGNPLTELLAVCALSRSSCGVVTTGSRWAFARLVVLPDGVFRLHATRFFKVNEAPLSHASMHETVARFLVAAAAGPAPLPAAAAVVALLEQCERARAGPPLEEDDSDDSAMDLSARARRLEGFLASSPAFQALQEESPGKAWKHKAGAFLLAANRPAAPEPAREGFRVSYLELVPSLLDPTRTEEDARIVRAESRVGCVVRKQLSGRDCAVKVLPCALARDEDCQPDVPQTQRELLREEAVYARLEELQRAGEVPTLHGLFSVALGFAWLLVMSFEGEAFSRYGRSLTGADVREMKRILGRVHASGVLHGHLALRHFVKSETGKVALLDFGLARLRQDEEAEAAWERAAAEEMRRLDELLSEAGWSAAKTDSEPR